MSPFWIVLPVLLISSSLAEHVYEPQLAVTFYEWLADGQTVGTHKKPSKDWVQKVLVDSRSTDLFMLDSAGRGAGKLGTKNGGDFLHAVIAYGFGRSDGTAGSGQYYRREKKLGQKDLTLVYRPVNNKKGKWFQGDNRPNAITAKNDKAFIGSVEDAREIIRVVSTATYLSTLVVDIILTSS